MNPLSRAAEAYQDLMTKQDERTSDWLMMSSPWLSLFICIFYFISVSYGKALMQNRPPVEIKNVIIVYNLMMVALCTYIFVEFLLSGWATGYSFACQPVDYSRSPQAMRMANVCWWFFFSKFIELLDTYFFIMRKKFQHVSFLHVFHHGIMPISWWFGVKFVPGGFGTFHAMLNSFIHVLMYTYYGLSALGPAFQRFLFWKRYMTRFQMLQFCLVMIHSSQLLFIDCDYPQLFVYWIGSYAFIFLILFADFYRKAYLSVAVRGDDRHRERSPAEAPVSNGVPPPMEPLRRGQQVTGDGVRVRTPAAGNKNALLANGDVGAS